MAVSQCSRDQSRGHVFCHLTGFRHGDLGCLPFYGVDRESYETGVVNWGRRDRPVTGGCRMRDQKYMITLPMQAFDKAGGHQHQFLVDLILEGLALCFDTGDHQFRSLSFKHLQPRQILVDLCHDLRTVSD